MNGEHGRFWPAYLLTIESQGLFVTNGGFVMTKITIGGKYISEDLQRCWVSDTGWELVAGGDW